jgi:ribose 5-phosphate isomerase A
MNEKQAIAEQAARRIQAGMLVGLGTGSTAHLFIDALAQRVKQENLAVTTVASSVISAIKAKACGLPLLAFEQLSTLDVYVDGADEVTPDLSLLKGRGSDLVREKLLANASKAFWVLADQSKWVTRLGERYPIPVEVLPFAWQLVQASLYAIGGQSCLRHNASNDNLVTTAQGNLVLDVVFDRPYDSPTLDQLLNNIPGVVEHGIFCKLATEAIKAN